MEIHTAKGGDYLTKISHFPETNSLGRLSIFIAFNPLTL